MQNKLTQRVQSLDLAKGIILILMALDHTRDYFHAEAFLFNPLDSHITNWPIYTTRWITNFCAPAFSFLAGVSVFFVSRRRSPFELSKFLFKRGVWLIFIQVTIINFAWNFDSTFRSIELDVIASLGISMIILSFLVHTPKYFILAFSCLLIFGHNFFDSFHFNGNIWWSILHESASFPINNYNTFAVWYPLIPWVGVMSLGFWMGKFYDKTYDPNRRKKWFIWLGFSAIALFVILRGFNIYGNPTPWVDFDSISKNLMSILNTHKYPPSLSFLLITLGPTFLFLAYSENIKGKIVRFFMTFGRVPFFFYIIHLYVIHLLAMIASEATWTGWEAMLLTEWVTDVDALKGYGFSLEVVYLVWALIIIILYPLCKKFDRYKMNHKEKEWLSYL
jgi:uncharacterized membrane protein